MGGSCPDTDIDHRTLFLSVLVLLNIVDFKKLSKLFARIDLFVIFILV